MIRPANLLLPFFIAIGACSAPIDHGDADLDARADGIASDASDRTDASHGDTPIDTSTCSCAGRTCGTDSCGHGSCGSCPSGQSCDSSGQCVLPTCPCWAGGCSTCMYCSSAISTYGAAHGCTVPGLASHPDTVWRCDSSGWTPVDNCTAGCTINSSGPDYCTPTGSHHLFIVMDNDAAVTSCRGNTDGFWNCILPHTNFNALATAWTYGRALSYAGSYVLPSRCSFHYDTSATPGQDSATFQCIEDQLHLTLSDDDVVAYIPANQPNCEGRNHWHIAVNTPGGSRSLEIAMIYGVNDYACHCQTALGMHEVYEAASSPQSADCCNSEGNSTWMPQCTGHGSGWYSFNACGQSWEGQTVSPASAEWDPSQCQQLH